MAREYFTKQEALEKVGRLIETLVEFSGVPKGSSGTVVRIYEAGWDSKESYGLDIQWHLSVPSPSATQGEVEGEPVLFIQTGKPRIDDFTKSEYETYLKELPDPQ